MMATDPTQTLEDEHKHILKVIERVKAISEQITNGKQVSGEQLNEIVEFMRNYADRCHHGKEEAILFPFLLGKGAPEEGCPIGALKQEHIIGREQVHAIADNADAYLGGDEQARQKLLNALNRIIKLYPNHIWKEDYLLFPMTHKVCSAEDLGELNEQFNAADDQFGREVIKGYEEFANA